MSGKSGKEKSMCYLEDSLASHTALQANGWEKKTPGTSGRKCLEQFMQYSPPGSWARMFAGLLVGMEGWFSTRCNLTWRLRDTTYSRFYFQLQASTLRTEENGSGLLLTPSVTMISGRSEEAMQKRKAWRESTGRRTVPPGNLAEQISMIQNGMSQYNMVLPTPTAQDFKQRGPNSRQQGLSNTENWINLLPTPTSVSDAKGGATRSDPKRQGGSLANAIHGVVGTRGKTSQLNPRFVMEMMGFPPDWTESPLQNGGTKVSGQEVMP